MEYKVILDDEFIKFNKRVETAQQEGWQCQGGVSVSYDSNDDAYFAQAMVKHDINIHKGSVYDGNSFISLYSSPQETRESKTIIGLIGMQGAVELAKPVYKVGDRVRVIDNTTHHNFDIGAEVIVEGVYEHPKPYITSTYQDRSRNLYFEDITLVRRRPAMSKAP